MRLVWNASSVWTALSRRKEPPKITNQGATDAKQRPGLQSKSQDKSVVTFGLLTSSFSTCICSGARNGDRPRPWRNPWSRGRSWSRRCRGRRAGSYRCSGSWRRRRPCCSGSWRGRCSCCSGSRRGRCSCCSRSWCWSRLWCAANIAKEHDSVVESARW